MSLLQETMLEDFLDLTFRKDLNIMLLRWTKKVNSAELKSGYLRALSEAKANGTRFWFLDLRRRGPLPPDDENWTLNSFMADLGSSVKEPYFFAYLVSPTHYKQLDRSVGIERLKHFSRHISIQVFYSEDIAITWLLNMQRLQAGVAQ